MTWMGSHLEYAGMLAALEDLLSAQYFAPLAFAAVAILLLRRPRKPPTTPPSTTAARALSASLGTQDRLRRDLESLMVELQELSRKIGAEIDTRFAKLEAAMRDADRRIASLNRLARKTGQTPPPPEDPGEADLRHQIVYELADAGMKAIEIAKELGKTPGEVELILNLRGRTSKPLTTQLAPSQESAASAPPDSEPPAASEKPRHTTRTPRERKKTEPTE